VSALGLPLTLAQNALAMRALGPGGFGIFSLLTSFFSETMAMLETGTSTALYTKLSARPHEASLLAFYWRFTAAVVLLLLAFVLFVLFQGSYAVLWIGAAPLEVGLAFVSGVLLWLSGLLGKVADALVLTVRAEKQKLLSRVLGVALIAAGFLGGILSLPLVFVSQIFTYGLITLLTAMMIIKTGFPLLPLRRVSSEQVRQAGREFWQYSHPLMVYTIIGALVAYCDRWLLQLCAGSSQQGFYGLAFQVGGVAFIFTASSIPLLARDFARFNHRNARAAIGAAFTTSAPKLYALSCFIAVFVAGQAEAIAGFVGGEGFKGASTATALMCLYPIHQTYGQLNGTVFYATNATGTYRNIGIVNMLMGLLLTGVLLAPADFGGLSLGSGGLAVKMLVTQVIGTNVQLIWICRRFELKYSRLLLHQILCLAGFAAACLIARQMQQLANLHVFASIAVSAAIYCVLSAGMVWLMPALAGCQRSELAAAVARVRLYLNSNQT
jgi:O-antigen/teichoic acid export membrane protein